MIVAIIGIVILLIATIGALLWVQHSATAQARQTKILLFGLYFWVLAFVQLIIAGLGYYLMRR